MFSLIVIFSLSRNILSFILQRKHKKMNDRLSNNILNAKSKPKIVYVQDCIFGEVSKLYTLDLATGQASFVGALTTDVYDIACVGSQLYGINQEEGSKTTKLVKINSATGEVTEVGDIGFYVVGLAYNAQDETLYASAAKKLIAIDLETGRGKPAITFSRSRRSCGEVAFDRHGNSYK